MTDIRARCRDCEWTATAPATARDELNWSMIDHFLETGHTIAREAPEEARRPTATGSDGSPSR